jgi:uncharacterized protein HemX
MAWTDSVAKAAPELLAACVGGMFTIALACGAGFFSVYSQQSDRFNQQQIQLTKMNETLVMICNQMKEQVATDARQDAQITDLRVSIERLRR